MKLTFTSQQYNTTVEINFEATHIDQIREMFDQFLRGSGFHFEDEEDMYSKQEISDTSEKRVHETDISSTADEQEKWDITDMSHRTNGLSVEQNLWVGLTDAEVALYEIRLSCSGVARDIEAALRSRNT